MGMLNLRVALICGGLTIGARAVSDAFISDDEQGCLLGEDAADDEALEVSFLQVGHALRSTREVPLADAEPSAVEGNLTPAVAFPVAQTTCGEGQGDRSANGEALELCRRCLGRTSVLVFYPTVSHVGYSICYPRPIGTLPKAAPAYEGRAQSFGVVETTCGEGQGDRSRSEDARRSCARCLGEDAVLVFYPTASRLGYSICYPRPIGTLTDTQGLPGSSLLEVPRQQSHTEAPRTLSATEAAGSRQSLVAQFYRAVDAIRNGREIAVPGAGGTFLLFATFLVWFFVMLECCRGGMQYDRGSPSQIAAVLPIADKQRREARSVISVVRTASNSETSSATSKASGGCC